MTFNEAILHLIKQNSGGIKLTQLVADIMVVLEGKEQISDVNTKIVLPEFLASRLSELESIGTIGILKYGFRMGDTVREQQFIYTPLESS